MTNITPRSICTSKVDKNIHSTKIDHTLRTIITCAEHYIQLLPLPLYVESNVIFLHKNKDIGLGLITAVKSQTEQLTETEPAKKITLPIHPPGYYSEFYIKF